MRSVFTRIVSQRQRALRVAALAFGAGALLHLGHPGHVGPLPVPLFTGLIYALLITPAAVLTAAVLPALTALSDAVQWARLAFATGVAAFPDLLRPVADAPLANATVVIVAGSLFVALQRRRFRLMPALQPA